MAETTDPDNDDWSEMKSDGTRKRWAVILGKVYRPFYYTSYEEAYKVVVDTFKTTYKTPIDREIGEIYQLWSNERRLVEMYFNINGVPQPSPEINDQKFPWKRRRLFEIPSRPKNSAFSFLVTWQQSGFPISRRFHLVAYNYEIARKQVDAEMRKIFRGANTMDTEYHVTYLGVSNR